MRRLIDQLGMLWCCMFHDNITLPIHEHYECRKCQRKHAVQWAKKAA